MPTAPLLIDDLLDPISPQQPAGVDLRWTPEWDRIKEARRADDALESGKWAKRDHKVADWRLVQQLAAEMLRERSKDLQFAMWLTEANIKLDGFPGLRDGLRLLRELIVRYWDSGLYPLMEDGPEDRAGPLQWLSHDTLVSSIIAIPVTVRLDGGPDYNFIQLQDSRRVGSEAKCKDEYGDIDLDKKKKYDKAISEGRISLEQFERAVRETRRADYEEFNSVFQQTYDEFNELEKVIDEKFIKLTDGKLVLVAPDLSACRTALRDIRQEISDILDTKRKQEPVEAPEAGLPGGAESQAERGDAVVVRFPLALPAMQGPQPAGSSWNEAEALIRSGQVDRGLAEMTRLAASETSGRNRFQRKLLLAEVCLASKRERLARSILEELAEQIDKFQLEFWETSELVSSVWTRLYQLYRQGEAGSSDAERAKKLYDRLCRLDPWQALACGEA
jgi:type VI secretion system protein ImpA